MTRRALLASAALLAACKKGIPRDDLLPAMVLEWKRTTLGAAAPDSAVIPQSSIRRVQSATYEASGKVEVTLYELSSSAAALDAVQRWRPAADTVFFYHDDLFVVVKYRDADRKALNAFVAALDKHLMPPQ